MSTHKYFGTDGIRGKANIDLTAELALKVGLVVGHKYRNGTHHSRVVIGKDTRRSGYMLENALVAGFTAAGMDVLLTGPIPTPGLAMLVKSYRADLGVMVTASHNPYADNGIKIFSADGYKLSDKEQGEIEAMVDSPTVMQLTEGVEPGRAKRIDGAQERYIEFCKHTVRDEKTFEGLKVVLDCANGAAYYVAPQVLRELGADIITLGVDPDGFNINEGCGSTAPALLQEKVREVGAHVGIALDGDADRLIVVDEKGQLVNGDQILALIAGEWASEKRLAKPTIAATVMSNLGLIRYLEKRGVSVVTTKVGDRYVLEAMHEHGLNLGGEQSGHIVMSDYTTTGDGLIAALQVLSTLQKRGVPMSEVAHCFDPLPQMLKSVPFPKGKKPLEEETVQAAITQAQTLLPEGGLLVRPSGTEPLVRVMAQGDDTVSVEKAVSLVVEAVAAL